MRRPSSRARLVLTAVLTTLTLGAPAGHALTPNTAPSARGWHASPANATRAAMHTVHVTGLVSDHPDAHGDVRARLADGRTAAIPATSAGTVMERSAAESPAAAATCGTSTVTVAPKGDGHPVRTTTGFTVDSPAVSYSWSVHITGPGYAYDYQAGGALASAGTWTGGHDTGDDLPQGTYTATLGTTSYAVLADGSVCAGAGPSASTLVTSPDQPVSHTVPTTTAAAARQQAASLEHLLPSTATARATTEATDPPVTPVSVPRPYSYPNTAVAGILVGWPDGSGSVCTGWMYGPNILGTAGHCLYDRTKGVWAQSFVISPGLDLNGTGSPYGYCHAVKEYSSAAFINTGDPDYDYGAVSVTCGDAPPAPIFGYRPPTQPNDPPPSTVTANGYTTLINPANLQRTATAPTLTSTERTFTFNVSMPQGYDGGPVYANLTGCSPCVVGLSSKGPQGVPATAVRVTQANAANFAAWKAATP